MGLAAGMDVQQTPEAYEGVVGQVREGLLHGANPELVRRSSVGDLDRVAPAVAGRPRDSGRSCRPR